MTPIRVVARREKIRIASVTLWGIWFIYIDMFVLPFHLFYFLCFFLYVGRIDVVESARDVWGSCLGGSVGMG